MIYVYVMIFKFNLFVYKLNIQNHMYMMRKTMKKKRQKLQRKNSISSSVSALKQPPQLPIPISHKP